jgi:hydrogenase 3 maturation protease
LVGVGNPIRGDDYVGSFIVKRIVGATDGALPENVHLFDAEDNVENLVVRLSRLGLRHVVFIDACEMRAKPGKIDLLSIAETNYPFFTTHGIPLKVLGEHLLKGSEVWVLAIQPKVAEFDKHLSPELRDAAARVSNFIISNLIGVVENA